MLPTPLTNEDRHAYDALHSSAIALLRPDLLHLEFAGPKAGDVITGLVTSHVLALGDGESQYAAALTAKGKIVADLRIVRLSAERFLTTSAEACWPGWRDLVRKFVNPRLSKYSEPAHHTVSVFGPLANEAADRALASIGAHPQPLGADTPFSTVRYAAGDEELIRIPSPELGVVAGVDLLGSAALADRLIEALTRDPQVTAGTPAALEVARVEAGRPRWGRDMDENTIPQEANLGSLGALSFDKGCYTGQETVARIHFRGHVNRHLRLLRAAEPMPSGAELRTAEGKVVGEVRSTVISPAMGPIAIGMVRREVEAGARLQVVADGVPVAEAAVER